MIKNIYINNVKVIVEDEDEMKIFRKEKIMELCVGKNVLHLGFIQHHNLYEKKIAEGDWLHEKINSVASYLVGIDYLKDDVNVIRDKYGYDVYYADVTDIEDMRRVKDHINMSIDVIVCGELIEHVDNPGIMLENLKFFMDTDTILIITTPNPFSYHRMKLMMNGNYECEWLNKEHVSWYSYQTLKQLLDRKGYVEVDYEYYDAERKDKVNSKLKSIIKDIIPLSKWHYSQELSDGLFFIASKVE